MCGWEIRYKACRNGCERQELSRKTVLCQEVLENDEPFGACDYEISERWILVEKFLCQPCVDYVNRVQAENDQKHKDMVLRRLNN